MKHGDSKPLYNVKVCFLFLICVGGYCALCLFVNVILCCVVCDGFACLWEGTVIGVNHVYVLCFILFFSVRLFVHSAWSFVFFNPATTANDLRLRRIFYPRFYPLHLFSYSNSWERASISLFNGTMELPGIIFITSLVWRSPWLGIIPGTSRTRCQHSTTRLSRRR